MGPSCSAAEWSYRNAGQGAAATVVRAPGMRRRPRGRRARPQSGRPLAWGGEPAAGRPRSLGPGPRWRSRRRARPIACAASPWHGCGPLSQTAAHGRFGRSSSPSSSPMLPRTWRVSPGIGCPRSRIMAVGDVLAVCAADLVEVLRATPEPASGRTGGDLGQHPPDRAAPSALSRPSDRPIRSRPARRGLRRWPADRGRAGRPRQRSTTGSSCAPIRR